jgi:hypothetical protein
MFCKDERTSLLYLQVRWEIFLQKSSTLAYYAQCCKNLFLAVIYELLR